MENARLAELVASKVCHDILGPMTAMVHGLELLKAADVSGKDNEALSLLENGVTRAAAKLDFYRHAFGAAMGGEQLGPLSVCKPAAEALFTTSKSSLVWAASEINGPRAAARVVLNMLMIANDCLAKGGTVTLEAEPGEVRIVAAGVRARLKSETSDGLRGVFSEEGFQALNVQPFLTALLARQAGVELLAREAPERIEFVLRSPAFQA